MDVRHVEVEIEELVLHGFDRIDGVAVAESLRSALGVHLAEGDLGKSRTVDLVRAPVLEVAPGTRAAALGRAVAERVHGSIRP
ncbi:MAG TPA: hypothetical protein VJ814_09805 [Gaiellaceae bacterium]|nr:hypothetical protein [Gaiellaceae bacterium]